MLCGEELVRLVSCHAYRQVRSLEVEVGEGVVVLRGTAPTFYAKQLAQEAVRRASSSVHIVNDIVVGRSARHLSTAFAS